MANSKRFTYCSSIISLYGYLENFLESIVKEFISELNSVKAPFDLLPKEIRGVHLESSIDLLRKIQRDRVVSLEQKREKIKAVVGNMNSCVQESAGYQLNEEAFSIHTANFRYDSIHNLFCKIGIHGLPKKVLADLEFQAAMARRSGVDFEFDQKILVSLLISELDSLAQRRNEIAHGSFDGELESVELVIERALLLKCFGSSINKILSSYYHEFIFSACTRRELGLPDRVFRKMNILGFLGVAQAVPEFQVSVGDKVYSLNENSSEKLKCGTILSIVSNNLQVGKIECPSAVDFAIKVDFDFGGHEASRGIFVVP